MNYLLRRLALTVPLLLVVSLLVFLVGEALPGDPAATRFDVHANPEAVAAWRELKGLDRPLFVRYLDYLLGILTELDFGQSYRNDTEVGPRLLARFSATIELSFCAMLLAIPVGLGAGIVSSVRRGKFADYAGNVLALLGISVPIFWLGMVLTLAAKAVGFHHFAARYDEIRFEGIVSGYSSHFYLLEAVFRGDWPIAWSCLQYILIPALALSTIPMAVITRMTRSAMLEEVGRDYVRTARAKGLPGRIVVLRHVLRNALMPVVTITGLQFGALLSGAVLTEKVFNWPGVGTYVLAAVQSNDSPEVVGGILLVSAVFIGVNLAVDLLYGVIDPRVRVGGGS